MKKINPFILIVLYSFIIGCSDEEFSNYENDTIEISSRNSQSDCTICPQLLANGSFEIVNEPVPGSLIQFKNQNVPGWINAAASPSVINNTGLPPNGNAIPPGFNGNNIGFIQASESIVDVFAEESIVQNIPIYGDQDIEYCLTYLQHQTSYPGVPIAMGNITVLFTNDVPEYLGSDFGSSIDLSLYDHEQIISSTPNLNTWDLVSTSITPGQDFNQLCIIPKVTDESIVSPISMLTIDDINLSCATNALTNIKHTLNGSLLNLSAVFTDLPSDVTITSYSWLIQNADNNINSSEANPSVNINLSSEPLSVCLKIVDSRGCCATFCIEIEAQTCPDGSPLCDYSVCYDDIYVDRCPNYPGTLINGSVINSLEVTINGVSQVLDASTPGLNFPYCYGYSANPFCSVSGLPSIIDDFPNDLNNYMQSLSIPGHSSWISSPLCRHDLFIVEQTCLRLNAFNVSCWDGSNPRRQPLIEDCN